MPSDQSPPGRIPSDPIADLFRQVCSRPGMYVSPATFGTVCAFIGGFDMARDGGPLNGLREWLIVRCNGGNNLHWSGLAGDLVPGGGDEARRIAGLGELLDEFFHHRNAAGAPEIFYAYAKWLRRRGWYRARLRDRSGGAR